MIVLVLLSAILIVLVLLSAISIVLVLLIAISIVLVLFYLPITYQLKNLIGKVKVKGELVSYQKFPKEIKDFQRKTTKTTPCPHFFAQKPS